MKQAIALFWIECLSDRVTYEQSCEWSKGRSYAGIQGYTVLGERIKNLKWELSRCDQGIASTLLWLEQSK